MEWNIYSEDDVELLKDQESEEAANDELQEDSITSLTRPASARRTIEIIWEQKQLEADTWDYFEH